MSQIKELKTQNQSGFALFIGLVILIVVTLIGVTSMRNTTLQERMAGHERESQLAFQAAENALRQAEALTAAGALDGSAVNFDRWEDYGLEIYDCAGARFINNPDVSSWPLAPEQMPGQTLRYEIIQMSAVTGRAVACRPLEEESAIGAGNRSSYYLVMGHANSPSGNTDALVVTTYYYEDEL